MNKKNLIDGLPASYDHNYVIKTEKQCPLCGKAITSSEIEGNSIVCTESFDFIHKGCADSNDLELVFSKPNDPTSMVKVSKKR